jgi:transposase
MGIYANRGGIKMAFPDWVEKFRKSGYEIKENNGKYYYYELKSRWDKEKKKPVKKTGEYLGTIKPWGFVPKSVRVTTMGPIVNKEYGASAWLCAMSADILELLKQGFDEETANSLYVLSLLRVKGEPTFKRAEHEYETSYLSENIPGLNLSGPRITTLLNQAGGHRDKTVKIMNTLSGSTKNILIDGSRVTSFSKGMSLPQIGHSQSGGWDPQVNVMYVFECAELPQPVFYRCVYGNIPDVSAMKLTIESMEREGDMTVVGDTGFASDTNFQLLHQYNMAYIVPLKRNSAEVSEEGLRLRGNFDIAFTYNKRPVTAYETKRDGYRIIVFRDESLKSDEMTDFIARLEKKNAAVMEAKEKTRKTKKAGESLVDIGKETIAADPSFGTIIMRTNTDISAEEVYKTYKLRVGIEQCFDSLKNTLQQDHSYMHSDDAFETWCFINHLALIISYRVFNTIKKAGLTNRYSLKDAMAFLSRIEKLNIGGVWHTSEYTKQAVQFCSKLGLSL